LYIVTQLHDTVGGSQIKGVPRSFWTFDEMVLITVSLAVMMPSQQCQSLNAKSSSNVHQPFAYYCGCTAAY